MSRPHHPAHLKVTFWRNPFLTSPNKYNSLWKCGWIFLKTVSIFCLVIAIYLFTKPHFVSYRIWGLPCFKRMILLLHNYVSFPIYDSSWMPLTCAQHRGSDHSHLNLISWMMLMSLSTVCLTKLQPLSGPDEPVLVPLCVTNLPSPCLCIS